jgi:hypothetical protein
LSPSSSGSASPSIGFTLYSRGDEPSLPTDTSDLETIYSEAEEINVSTSNDVRVEQTGTAQYMIHQFRDFVGEQNSCSLECELQSSLAPSSSTIYLQIYNNNTSEWVTVDSDNSSSADTDLILSTSIADLTDYKDGSNVIVCRVYQLGI